jgi:potassium efflux system protein
MLNIIPFFDIDAPAAYAHLIQLPLLITLCVIFGSRWPRRLFYYWLFLVLLYMLFSAANFVLVPRMSVRYWLLLLQLISVSLGYIAMRRITQKNLAELDGPGRGGTVPDMQCAGHSLQRLGRLSLSKLFSTSAIFGLVQVVGLAVFVNCLMEGFSLQSAVSKTNPMGRPSPCSTARRTRPFIACCWCCHR